MKLTLNLSPVSRDTETTASLTGTVLTLNGVDYDLAELPDGAEAKHEALGTVTRSGDEYECTVILGHGPNAPEATRFPTPLVLIDHSGDITLPLYDAPQTEEVPA